MSEERNEYRQVFKATSLFGGVQILQILISVARSKIVAVLLGPSGMGIIRLLNTTINLVSVFTSFGLSTSAVKYISAAFFGGEEKKALKVVFVLKRLLWYSGLLGAILLVVVSPFLSRVVFGSEAYTFSLIWVSIVVLVNQLTQGRLSILQGMRKLKDLAKANVAGSFLALALTAPLYYFFGTEAIVPAIIVTALVNFYFSWFYLRKKKIPTVKLGFKQTLTEGKEMIQLGLVLGFSAILTTATAYLLQIYISNYGGIDQVGLYSAGFVILNTYVGLIFNAMGKDYFPRLSSISENNEKVRKTVLHQAFIAVFLIAPMIVGFLALAPQLIGILFSSEFLEIEQMVSWGILGMLFKAVSWSMGYVIIAKGDSKIFTKTAVIFNSLQLLLNIVGYYFGGLTGLGMSFFAYYILHFVGIKIIVSRRYNFYFPKKFYLLFLINIVFCGAAFLLTYISLPFWKYGALAFLWIASCAFTLHHLDKELDLKNILKHILRRKK